MKQPKNKLLRFFCYVSFLIYAVASFPYYVVKRWVVNYTYDKEYTKIYKEGKKTFDTPRQVMTLTMPKQCITLKPRKSNV